ncbi:Putative anti-sigma factor antagonist [Fundidesulfovibrio magnetotacticus]|uniref:Anti-sigma factor antagonist n=1 Tax=Fundidesulfovibrio magnetotacticus TaxID=2730080 RepID=A0A6V8LR68_9BACT|nr:STAS domain-containing protein [Fundidesulfovibrio magnetotacticus]GFK93051.1 Putative anti-sigma factor antagonist [Fundidesulfovibrio magnetotacticus]
MENLTWRNDGECLIGRFAGEITMEITQDLKRAVEKALADTPAKPLVLDLSEVSFMDSSGIGFLVACNTRLQASGRALALLSPSSQVRKTLGLVQLMEFFKVAETEADLQNLAG